MSKTLFGTTAAVLLATVLPAVACDAPIKVAATWKRLLSTLPPTGPCSQKKHVSF